MDILGGGNSWQEVVARVALRQKLKQEPTIPEFHKYTERLEPDVYTALAKRLEVEIYQSFYEEKEVQISLIPIHLKLTHVLVPLRSSRFGA